MTNIEAPRKSDGATPVLLLAFNRPETTKRVFEAIRAARPSRLFIAADGPRDGNTGDIEKSAQVRTIANLVDWPCEVKTLFHEKNLGCRFAPPAAIDWFFTHVEEGIILEDDCIPDPSFFTFCETLLEKYRDAEDVMLIAGSRPGRNIPRTKDSYFFSDIPFLWGWATWKRAWAKHDLYMRSYPSFIVEKKINRITQDPQEQEHWLELFDEAYRGRKNTWDYPLLYAIWNNRGKSIVPNKNLITNIGFSENATHTKNPESQSANLPRESILFPLTHPTTREVDGERDRKIFYTLFGNYLTRSEKTKRFLRHLFRKGARGRNIVMVESGRGRLANQLWNLVSLYAYCVERGYTLLPFSFARYAPNFKNVTLPLYIKLLYRDVSNNWILSKIRPQHLFMQYMLWRHKFKLLSDNSKTPFYLPPSAGNTGEHEKRLIVMEREPLTSLYVQGWLFRNPVGIEKHRSKIREYLRLAKAEAQAIRRTIMSLRTKFDYVVGVHIRQGDYRTFQEGKLSVASKRFAEIATEFLAMKMIPKEKVVFLICSDNSVRKDDFQYLHVEMAAGTPIHDLFLLSETDAIIGSDSTFGAFASYYGDIPFIIAKNEPIDWEYYKGRGKYFENKYSTTVHY